MTIEELTEILEETLDDRVASISTLTGAPVTSSKDLLNPALLSYEGRLELASGQTLLWALTRDDEGWELSSMEA